MNTEKKKVERVLHLNLEVTEDFFCVTSIDNESAETYTLDFRRGVNEDGVPYHKPIDIMTRIGMEVWSWLQIAADDFEHLDDGDGE